MDACVDEGCSASPTMDYEKQTSMKSILFKVVL